MDNLAQNFKVFTVQRLRNCIAHPSNLNLAAALDKTRFIGHIRSLGTKSKATLVSEATYVQTARFYIHQFILPVCVCCGAISIER